MVGFQTTPRLADGPFKLITTPQFRCADKGDEFTAIATHMALVHNIFIRTLNTIYQQAPHVQPADYSNFISYSSQLCPQLVEHHSLEETTFFPKIDEIYGKPGLTSINIEEHKAFHDGLDAMNDYFTSLRGKENEFDGKKLVEIIDSFGHTLTSHLAAEVDFLDNLRQHGSEYAPVVSKMMNEEGAKASGNKPLTTDMSFLFVNHDVEFEGGIHEPFPEAAPRPVVWSIRNVFMRWHAGWWKFASCDSAGKMRSLYAGPPVE